MPRARNDGLTPREKEVVFLKLQGYSYNQIATILDVKYSAVCQYINRIYHKLGVHCRSELYDKWMEIQAEQEGKAS